MDATQLLDTRLLIVTGKGGVGKSSCAAALALVGARSGRRTCLVEVEGRQTMARLFHTQPWDFAEREFRPGLFGLSVDPEASLVEYLDMFYGARRLSQLVVGSTAVEFATTAAPGIKDVLLIGKVKEMERRRDPDGRLSYDLIVMDAPPTGRIVNFLRAPEATTELVNLGPIKAQAQTLIEMISDPSRTHLQLVTLLEELPVQETLEGVASLREFGATVGPVLVNRALPERFDEPSRKALTDDLEPGELQTMLDAEGLKLGAEGAEALRELGMAHLGRLDLQARMREQLTTQLDLPTIELPFIYSDRFADREVEHLADVIEEAIRDRTGSVA
jgi:anion-transporting  ArsA/GET3 family ATPase